MPFKKQALIDLKKIADTLSEKDIILTYQGSLNEVVIMDLLRMTEGILKDKSIEKGLRKKVFIILVESLQNSFKHSMGLSEQQNRFTVALTRKEGCFDLVLGNYIPLGAKEELKSRLSSVNEMTKEQLSAKYLEVLNDGVMSDKGGSGLGLMDIVRKSGNKLNYDFVGVDDSRCYFTLQINISK